MTDQGQPTSGEPTAPAWPPPPVGSEPTAPAWPPPPVGSEPTAPAWPPPPAGQPGWAPVAAPAPAWPPPPVGSEPTAPAWPPPAGQAGWAPVAAPARSTSFLVLLAAAFLLLAGLVTMLLGSLLLVGSAIFSGAQGVVELDDVVGGEILGALAGMVAVVALLVILWGILEVVGAFGIMARRTWGRAIGLVVGAIGLLFSTLSLVGTVGATASGEPIAGPTAEGLVGPIVIVAGYALTVFALLTRGGHFGRT